MIIRRPLHKLKLPDQLGLQPPAFLHLLRREALPPATAAGLRQVVERAILYSRPRNRLISFSLNAGVNPFRVRDA